MREREALLAKWAQLERSPDAQNLRQFSARLREHAEQLHTYIAALYSFHERVGALRP